MSHRTRETIPRDVSILPTGPLPSMAALSSSLRLSQHFLTRGHLGRGDMDCSHNPTGATAAALAHRWFRLVPVRSPLLRESRLISIPPGTEMFQFPGFASLRLCIQRRMTGLFGPDGFPHSDIHGSRPVWRLPVAFRSLPRPSSLADARASTVRPLSLNHRIARSSNPRQITPRGFLSRLDSPAMRVLRRFSPTYRPEGRFVCF